jgi:hypothetical protein
MSAFDAKADKLLQKELDRYERGEVTVKAPREGSLASNNRKPKKQRCSSRAAVDPVAAMEQLLQEDMAAYGTGCLPESFVGSSSYSFCPCPGQHGSTISTQQQQQQDSASWAEFEDDGVQELLQAEARQLLRGEYSPTGRHVRVTEVVGLQHTCYAVHVLTCVATLPLAEANKIQEPAWGPDAAAFAALGACCVGLQAVPDEGKCQLP